MKTADVSNKQVIVAQLVEGWLPITETWLYNQVRFLPSEIQSHVICEFTENLAHFPFPNIHSLGSEPLWRYYLDKGMRRLGVRHHLGFLLEQAKKYSVQVLHSHFGHTGWANSELADANGLRHVTSFYGLDLNFLPKQDPRWLNRYQSLFVKAERILCEGPHMARCIIQLGCPESKVTVHHLGVAVEEIAFRPRKWQPNEPLKVLIAASFREKKGIPYALEALGILQQDIPLEITIIGDANNEERSQAEKRKILSVINKYVLGQKVRMLGYQPHKFFWEEAYKHHVFLSPSVTASDGDTEGGAPVTIIEMLASGMPVISTRHCDIPHVVHHGETGFLAAERDVKGLVEQLHRLVDHTEQWKEILNKGRRRVEREFNARIQGEMLGAIYRDLAV